jgi:hypothetical protein
VDERENQPKRKKNEGMKKDGHLLAREQANVAVLYASHLILKLN